jgi:hypothetical protein
MHGGVWRGGPSRAETPTDLNLPIVTGPVANQILVANIPLRPVVRSKRPSTPNL